MSFTNNNNITFLFIYNFLNCKKLKHNFYLLKAIIYLIKTFIYMFKIGMSGNYKTLTYSIPLQLFPILLNEHPIKMS